MEMKIKVSEGVPLPADAAFDQVGVVREEDTEVGIEDRVYHLTEDAQLISAIRLSVRQCYLRTFHSAITGSRW